MRNMNNQFKQMDVWNQHQSEKENALIGYFTNKCVFIH